MLLCTRCARRSSSPVRLNRRNVPSSVAPGLEQDQMMVSIESSPQPFAGPLDVRGRARLRRHFATAALGRHLTHGNPCSVATACRFHAERRADPAANRTRDLMGRRCALPSFSRAKSRAITHQRTDASAPRGRGGRSEAGTTRRHGSRLALHPPGSRRARGAVLHGGRVAATVETPGERRHDLP